MLEKFKRKKKIVKALKKEISNIFQLYIKDPRIKFITISNIQISKDFMYAKIFVTFLNIFSIKNKQNIIKNSIKILNGKMNQYIRIILKKKTRLRSIPFLTFFYDQTLIESMKIFNLIQKNKLRK